MSPSPACIRELASVSAIRASAFASYRRRVSSSLLTCFLDPSINVRFFIRLPSVPPVSDPLLLLYLVSDPLLDYLIRILPFAPPMHLPLGSLQLSPDPEPALLSPIPDP